MKRYFFLIILTALVLTSAKGFANDIYEITVYHFKDAQQGITLDTYLQTALLPALHRKDKKSIGVFKPMANDTAVDKIIYVIVPYNSFEEMVNMPQELMKDNVYKTAGDAYLNANYKTPPYSRIENIILEAFPLAPQLIMPNLTSPKADHVYELRSYESATEVYHINKVKMFNEGGEVEIFKKINANAVFYGDVIAGCHMPNLMYLTSYENMAERDAHWKTFGDDAKWKQLNTMDEYKNNVSKADIILMHAAAYSDY